MTRESRITIGPSFPAVPVTHFNKHHVTHEEYLYLWRTLVGPHVFINSKLVEPWKVMCNLYLEGLLIGYGLAERQKTEAPDAEPGADYYGA